MEATAKKYPELFKSIYKEIKKELKHNGITVVRKKFSSNVGRAWMDEKRIKIPVLKDIESVHVILHEIAHIKLDHSNRRIKTHTREYEAEIFSLSYMRRIGIHKLFPKDFNTIKDRAVDYVILHIKEDLNKGLKNHEINDKALIFCKSKLKFQ